MLFILNFHCSGSVSPFGSGGLAIPIEAIRVVQVRALIANKIGVVMIIIVKPGLIRMGSTNGGAVDSNSVTLDFTKDFEGGLIVGTLEGVIFARTRFTDDVVILLLEPPQLLD
ncbi:Major facilitator superfamily protein [Forsythia ovata]|uniref:Major facilitator superfamily protein n=1 Tax=Forsythia ovata TaxID=205694 RepID=A0ABD1SIB7_9LAMI